MLKRTLKWINDNFWVVEITTLASMAFFLAEGTGELVVSELVSSFPVVAQASIDSPIMKIRQRRDRPFGRTSGDPVLRRNLFDSATGPIDRHAVDEKEQVEIGETKDTAPIPCTQDNVRLLATVVSEDNDWSFASLSEGESKSFLRIGDRIGEREVAWISWRYLLLEGQEDFCYIDIFGEENLVTRKAGKRPKLGSSATKKSELKKHVKVVGKNERVVDRQLVNQVMANPAQFTKKVRFRPKRRKGKIIGYQLRRMRRDSPLSLLGLKRRDVIREINGIELTSTNKVLEAYQHLRTSDELRFSVTRRGNPTELKIRIQ
jgi:general secretion pathway protein C